MPIPSIRSTLIGFLIASSASIALFNQGPNSDEGIYLIAGLELLDGFTDSYSSWHNGSPYIWSLLAGWMYSFSSLIMVRIFTAVLATGILFQSYLHSKTFLSQKDAELDSFGF